jgi:Uma2 family endonuclease
MQLETTRKRFNVDEYYRMAETGIIGPEERVELIDGEVLEMTPIGHRHAISVDLATETFVLSFAGRAIVRIQNPLRLGKYTEPVPDVVLLKHRADRYRGRTVMAEDAILVMEVSDTTLRYDRDIKRPMYAAAGIPEMWIVNLETDELFVYRDPVNGVYTTSLVVSRSGSISVSAFPETNFKIDDLLA